MNSLVIALNAYRESIRRKTLVAFLMFSMLLIGSSTFLTVLSPGEEIKMVKDVCLSAISFFGMLIAVFAAGALIPTEMDNRTIYTILSKPMKRFTYLLGKFIGAQLTGGIRSPVGWLDPPRHLGFAGVTRCFRRGHLTSRRFLRLADYCRPVDPG